MAITLLENDCEANIDENMKRILAVVNGVLPTVAAADNGKVLTVVNGEWAAAAPAEAGE